MPGSVTSSTTKLTLGFAWTFLYLALRPMLKPAMSIVPKSRLQVKPTGFTWGVPSGPRVARCPRAWRVRNRSSAGVKVMCVNV